MNQLHTMPLKCEAFFSSMKVRGMRWDERGIYLVSLAEAWLNGGHLPNDMDAIKRLLGVTKPAEWKRIKANVIDKCYTISEDGERLENEMLTHVYGDVLTRHARLSEAGRLGGKKSRKPPLSKTEASLKPGLSRDGKPSVSNQTQSQNQNQNQIYNTPPTPPPAVGSKQKVFIKPTEAEVAAQMALKGLTETEAEVQSAKFWNHHEARNWMLGRVKMSRWKAAVGTWMGNIHQFSGSNYQGGSGGAGGNEADALLFDLAKNKAADEAREAQEAALRAERESQ